MDLQKNADRFTGFADIYDSARPSLPPYAVDILCRYLGREPRRVVDLGCGTGLSTLAWARVCPDVVGVDPSGDMLAAARAKECPGIRFIQGFGHATGLPDASADVVVCSQSFHWMEPGATLAEAGRLLRPGGVFATVDCDWPPVFGWRTERAYMELYGKARRLEEEIPELKAGFIRYPKEEHLRHIRESGLFCYSRELLFTHAEPFTMERLVRLLYSQGSLQAVLRHCPERIRGELGAFEEQAAALLGKEMFRADLSYRIRMGIRNVKEGVDAHG